MIASILNAENITNNTLELKELILRNNVEI